MIIPESQLQDPFSHDFKPCIFENTCNESFISTCFGRQLQYYSYTSPFKLVGECIYRDGVVPKEEYSMYNRDMSFVVTNEGIVANYFSKE